MMPLSDLLVALAADLPTGAGGPDDGAQVTVTSVELTVPLESRLGSDGSYRGSLPRGIMRTGFVAPLGRLRARWERGEA